MKIVEYDIVRSFYTDSLVELVAKRIKNGWVLYGEPFSRSESIKDDMDPTMYDFVNQAMVKYENS